MNYGIIMFICSLYVAVYITVIVDAYSYSNSFVYDKCGLTPKENVDWPQIPSSVWYLSFESSDEIFSKVVNCQVIKYINYDLEGSARLHMKNYYYSGSDPKEFVMAAFKTNETAVYRGIQDAEFEDAESIVSCHLHDTVAADEGIRWVGVFTPTPYPTAEDLLGVRNTLIDLNVTSPLNFSQCSKVAVETDISTK
ncbi:uncharacterized protein LOC120342500 isoform X2 [Styela clava]